MKKMSFVILHYNTIEETLRCIESIKRMDGVEECSITVVDNASPNGTGKILAEKYKDENDIDVILRDKNDGFSKGNNEGCIYAVKKWNPDFLVVANNDIEFSQKDFFSLVQEEYEKKAFAVLGPDIFNPNKGIHQSPIAKDPPSMKLVQNTIFLNQLMLCMYPIMYPFMRQYFKIIENVGDVKNYKEYGENVCLMGACLIFSRDYIIKRPKIFAPETSFYYEENILSLWCKYNTQRVVYQPKIKVLHMEGSATSTVHSEEKQRIKFRMENILQAARVYRKFLSELEKKQI